jgi:hypothetical protein
MVLNFQEFHAGNLILKLLIVITAVDGFILACIHIEAIHGFLPIFRPFGTYLLLGVVFLSLIYAFLTWIDRVRLDIFIEKLQFSDPSYLAVFLIIALCLALLPLFICWSTSGFYLNNIGGLYPVMDAQMYYAGAEKIVQSGTLDAWDQRRPMHAVFLAFRLLITDFNYRSTLILQGLLLGFSAFLAALAVQRTHGKIAGIVLFGAILAFSTFYLPENLTESLGISFGCLSFAIVWYGIANKKEIPFQIGVLFLTLALMVRVGPMFILPAIIAYAGYAFRKSGIFNWISSAISFLSVSLGILFNMVLVWIFGDGQGMAFGNYAPTIYGLAAGGKGWQQYMIDFPIQVRNLPEGQLDLFLYQKSWELISGNPLQFVFTVLNGFITEPLRGVVQLYYILTERQNLSYFNPTLFYLAVFLLLIGVIFYFRATKNRSIGFLLAAIIAGTYLSLPFYFVDGGIRTLAAIFPYIALVVVLGTIGWRHPDYIRNRFKYSLPVPWAGPKVSLLIGLLLVVSIIVTPFIGPLISPILLHPPESIESVVCPSGEKGFAMRIDSGIPYIEILNDSDTRHTFAPQVKAVDFTADSTFMNMYNKYFDLNFPGDGTYPQLILGYDLVSTSSYYILAPNDFVGNNRRYVSFCAKYTNTSGLVNSGFEIDDRTVKTLQG